MISQPVVTYVNSYKPPAFQSVYLGDYGFFKNSVTGEIYAPLHLYLSTLDLDHKGQIVDLDVINSRLPALTKNGGICQSFISLTLLRTLMVN